MSKPQPPTFHIPVGPTRDKNGEVVLFKDDAEQDRLLKMWNDRVINHPVTLAAGACVIIGPTATSYMDLATHTVVQSRTPDDGWQPAALDDAGQPSLLRQRHKRPARRPS